MAVFEKPKKYKQFELEPHVDVMDEPIAESEVRNLVTEQLNNLDTDIQQTGGNILDESGDTIGGVTLPTIVLGETIPKGQPIRIVDNAGTPNAKNVFESSPAMFDGIGAQIDETGQILQSDVINISDNKIVSVHVWNPASGQNQIECSVGLVTGRTINLQASSSKVRTGSSFQTNIFRAIKLTDTLFVSMYPPDSTNKYPSAIAGTINNDNTINLGTPVDVSTASISSTGTDARLIGLCRLSDTKFLMGYTADLVTDVIRLVVGSVAGNVITFDEANQEDLSEDGALLTLVELGTDKYGVIYKDPAGNQDLKISVGTVSGTTPSTDEANQITFDGNEIGEMIDAEKLEDNKAIIHYRRSTATGSTSSRSRAVIFTVNGTTPTAGTSIETSSSASGGTATEYNTVSVINNSLAIAMSTKVNEYGDAIPLTISGTTITLGTLGSPGSATRSLCASDSVDRFVITRPNSPVTVNTLLVGIASSSTLHGQNYAGILQADGVSGDSVSYAPIGSVSTVHSGLDIDTNNYYLSSTDGSITTDPTSGYVAGIAESSTNLRVTRS